MFFTILGILAAVIFIIGDIPYFYDTVKGTTKPHRVTWGVVVLLNITGFANQYASGARDSLWLFGAAVNMTGAIFVASIPRGVGGHTKQDILAMIISLGGIVLWQAFDSPLLSIFANIVVASVALVPTFAKAKVYPETETKAAWVGGTTAAFLTAIAVGELDVQLLLLPVASFILQGYMVYILFYGHKKHSHKYN